jgi:hypothetical protein
MFAFISPEWCCFPEGLSPRENNIPRVNNYDVKALGKTTPLA